jgi:hypothetical protein
MQASHAHRPQGAWWQVVRAGRRLSIRISRRFRRGQFALGCVEFSLVQLARCLPLLNFRASGAGSLLTNT